MYWSYNHLCAGIAGENRVVHDVLSEPATVVEARGNRVLVPPRGNAREPRERLGMTVLVRDDWQAEDPRGSRTSLGRIADA